MNYRGYTITITPLVSSQKTVYDATAWRPPNSVAQFVTLAHLAESLAILELKRRIDEDYLAQAARMLYNAADGITCSIYAEQVTPQLKEAIAFYEQEVIPYA